MNGNIEFTTLAPHRIQAKVAADVELGDIIEIGSDGGRYYIYSLAPQGGSSADAFACCTARVWEDDNGERRTTADLSTGFVDDYFSALESGTGWDRVKWHLVDE